MHGLKFGILPDATDQRPTKARKSSVEKSTGRCFSNFAGRFLWCTWMTPMCRT